jgi:hypothetical protein
MNLISILVALVPLAGRVDAFWKEDYTVICSHIGPRKFEVCATSTYQYPLPGDFSLYVYGFEIIQGVPEGSDATNLTPEAVKVARRSGISVEIRGLKKNCSVAVTLKGNSTMCRSCSYCNQGPAAGDGLREWFMADCTNVPNGRFTGCESAALDTFMLAPYTGADPETAIEGAEVFFPLKRRALPAAPTPISAPKPRPPAPTPKSAPQPKAPATPKSAPKPKALAAPAPTPKSAPKLARPV